MGKRAGRVMVLLLMLALWAASARAEGNLLINGGFEELDGQDQPVGWVSAAWEEGASLFSVDGSPYAGTWCALVESYEGDDARFEQTVAVEPNALYRLSAMVCAEDIGQEEEGAGLSVEDTLESSDYLYETAGEWVQLTLYGQTGPEQTELTVMCRLGGYGSLNTGRAWFDEVELVRVEEAPEDAYVADFDSWMDGEDEHAGHEHGEDGEAAGEEAHEGSAGWMLLALGALAAAALIAFFALRRRSGRQMRPEMNPAPLDAGASGRVMTKRDVLTALALTAVYAVVAFVGLGSLEAPESMWTSEADGEQVVFDLGEVRSFHLTYYGGISDTAFTVSLSEDGEHYSEPMQAAYSEGEVFRWLWFTPMERLEDEWTGAVTYEPLEAGYPLQRARYVQLTSDMAGLTLGEVGFLDEQGGLIEATLAQGGQAAALLDEQQSVPEHPSYYNGTYFDEIYHARTGYEHLNGLTALEWSHPPLGKVLIMWGISLFGMNPFGWRFMGTLAGVLMVPLMYYLGKMLARRSALAFLAAFLLCVDFMHFTQTRVATIDSFVVLFILAMYACMFKYCSMSFFAQGLRRTLAPLALCGGCFALAVATKWTGLYAGAGLAVLFFWTIFRRWREVRAVAGRVGQLAGEQRALAQRAVAGFRRDVWITLGACVVFFVLAPALVYFLSYFWQLAPGPGLSLESVWAVQQDMWSYHTMLVDDHPFRSPWYEWPLIVRPIWYYDGSEFMDEGWVSTIAALGNPAVWWVGLLALAFVAAQAASGRARGDRRYGFVLVGFLAQYLPWVLVPRSTFIYHYFPAVPFLILAIALLFERLHLWRPRLARGLGWALMGAALALFVGFYPVLSGMPMPSGYAAWLRWFDWYF